MLNYSSFCGYQIKIDVHNHGPDLFRNMIHCPQKYIAMIQCLRVPILESRCLNLNAGSTTHLLWTLGKLFNISVLQFSHLENKDNI